MKEKDKLLRDIDTLRESIHLNWRDVGSLNLSAEEVIGIKKHIKWCTDELQELNSQLDMDDN